MKPSRVSRCCRTSAARPPPGAGQPFVRHRDSLFGFKISSQWSDDTLNIQEQPDGNSRPPHPLLSGARRNGPARARRLVPGDGLLRGRPGHRDHQQQLRLPGQHLPDYQHAPRRRAARPNPLAASNSMGIASTGTTTTSRRCWATTSTAARRRRAASSRSTRSRSSGRNTRTPRRSLARPTTTGSRAEQLRRGVRKLNGGQRVRTADTVPPGVPTGLGATGESGGIRLGGLRRATRTSRGTASTAPVRGRSLDAVEPDGPHHRDELPRHGQRRRHRCGFTRCRRWTRREMSRRSPMPRRQSGRAPTSLPPRRAA